MFSIHRKLFLALKKVEMVKITDEFFFLFLVSLNEMKMLGKAKVPDVNQGNKGGGESKIFLCYPKGSGTSHQSFPKSGAAFSVWEVFASD